jgi:hypothetical protein
MASRREILHSALVASALPLAGTLSSAWAESRRHFHCVVYDSRIEASVTFSRKLLELGSTIHPISGDMTDLWYGTLYNRWRTDPVAIAGLTAHGPLFCLERLGWEHGLRLTFRAEHTERPGGLREHSLSGPQFMSADIDALAGAGRNWPTRIADLITRDSKELTKPLPGIFVGSSGASVLQSAPGDGATLFSWVLVPIRRV